LSNLTRDSIAAPVIEDAQIAPAPAKLRSHELQAAIANIIRAIPRGVHLTASEVYRRAHEEGLRVSLSTIYRVLAGLQADGNISTVAGEHGRRYEARDSEHDHDHLICVKCGLTIEFEDDLIRGFGKTLAQRKGYEHSSSRFDIFGICADCKSKDEDHKIASAVAASLTAMELSEQCIEKLRQAVTLLEARKVARAQEAIAEALKQLGQALAEVQGANQILPTKDS
jgi:Fur family transcriptional regulator, ferric uptake regulator